MKRLILLAIVLVVFPFAGKTSDTPPIIRGIEVSVNDKVFLLNYYQETLENLQKSVAGLNEEQMHYKPSEEQWSVSQCLEHIVLAEKMLFGFAKETLEGPANPGLKEEMSFTDQGLIDGITDRSFRAEAPEALHGTGIYDDPETALHDIKEYRAVIMEFIQNTPIEDLRDHITTSPFGTLDAYQSLLFIAGHTTRHTLQIEEVKSSENFPE